MDITIREMQESDSRELLSLINNEFGYSQVTIDELLSRMEKMKEAGNYSIFAAVLDDKLVGFIGVVQEIALEIQNDYLRIIELVVSAAYQNKGIGSSLLRHVEKLADEKGISYITLSCALHRTEAHMFYESNGYSIKSYSFAKGEKRST